jgi:hypothetical protein
MFSRWHLCGGEKGVLEWERPSGAKVRRSAMADGAGFPISISLTSASPHEVTLVERALAEHDAMTWTVLLD